MRWWLALIGLTAACNKDVADKDLDGFEGGADCDDLDPAVSPDVLEVCDGIDNDCDGQIDEDGAAGSFDWFFDSDLDGFGDTDKSVYACDPSDGYVIDGGDCDDLDPAINPAALDVCDDLDNDCDGVVDADGEQYLHQDADEDGYGDPDVVIEVCEEATGWVENADDCDDQDSNTHPDALELCDSLDNDCDGEPETASSYVVYEDLDYDGYGNPYTEQTLCDEAIPDGYAVVADDCDDQDSNVHPDAFELCDGIDNDCDGALEAGTKAEYWVDADGDLFGDPIFGITACEPAEGYADNDGDCNDTEASVNPGALEICDDVDNDCDELLDEADDGLDSATWYTDTDLDGYGDDATAVLSCDPLVGSVSIGGDCDDLEADIHPDAAEACDLIDNDCDLLVDMDDDDVEATVWYADTDADGFGDVGSPVLSCDPVEGYVEASTDCDDDDPAINPGADEYCDSIDNDCDGLLDGKDPDSGSATWYEDGDGDGYGNPLSSTTGCSQPKGYVADDEDCDDTSDIAHPGAVEIWYDGIDGDCDGLSDFDQDMDTYDDATLGGGLDCDDTDTLSSPDGTETCGDAIDQDCNGNDLRCGIGGDLAAGSAPTIFDGANTYDYAGDSVAIVPDLNDDGIDDVVVGATGYDNGVGMGGSPSTGMVYVVFGPSTGAVDLGTESDVALMGEGSWDYAGERVLGGEDVTGDGFSDLLIGANGDDDGGMMAGAAYLVAGPLTSGTSDSLGTLAFAKLTGDTANDYAGSALGMADVDDDGSTDVVVGATYAGTGGEVYVTFGPVSSAVHDLGAADATITADGTFDYLGNDIATSDMDGDGVSDLFLSAPYAGASSYGEQYVFYGPVTADLSVTTDADVTITATTYYTGMRVAADGDLNDDGQLDLVVGAPYEGIAGTMYRGSAFVFFGPLTADTTTTSANAQLTGETSNDWAGYSVAENADVDNDGFDDLVVGAVGASVAGGFYSGVAYLVYGPVTATMGLDLADARLYGETGADYVGYDVSMGHANEDEFGDILVGAEREDRVAADAGAAFLFYGDE